MHGPAYWLGLTAARSARSEAPSGGAPVGGGGAKTSGLAGWVGRGSKKAGGCSGVDVCVAAYSPMPHG